MVAGSGILIYSDCSISAPANRLCMPQSWRDRCQTSSALLNDSHGISLIRSRPSLQLVSGMNSEIYGRIARLLSSWVRLIVEALMQRTGKH